MILHYSWSTGCENPWRKSTPFGRQTLRLVVSKFRLEAAGHNNLVEERSALGQDEGNGKEKLLKPCYLLRTYRARARHFDVARKNVQINLQINPKT